MRLQVRLRWRRGRTVGRELWAYEGLMTNWWGGRADLREYQAGLSQLLQRGQRVNLIDVPHPGVVLGLLRVVVVLGVVVGRGW